MGKHALAQIDGAERQKQLGLRAWVRERMARTLGNEADKRARMRRLPPRRQQREGRRPRASPAELDTPHAHTLSRLLLSVAGFGPVLGRGSAVIF